MFLKYMFLLSVVLLISFTWADNGTESEFVPRTLRPEIQEKIGDEDEMQDINNKTSVNNGSASNLPALVKHDSTKTQDKSYAAASIQLTSATIVVATFIMLI